MIWLLLAFFILLFLILLIIFSKLTIVVSYFHQNKNDDLKIEFRLWFGLIKYKKNVPFVKIDEDSTSIVVKSNSQIGNNAKKETDPTVNQITKDDLLTNLKNSIELLHRVINLHEIVKNFIKKISVKQLEWYTLIGIGDAAHTGVISGAIWAIKGSVIGLLSHYLNFKEMPNIMVTPHFQATIGQTKIKCIFQFRIGHAILAGLKLIKFWKGGLPHFKSKTNFSKEKTKSI